MRPILAAAAALLLLAPAGVEAKRVRLFAVGPKFDLGWVDNRDNFRAHLLALADRRERGDGAAAVQRGADDVASHLLGPADPRRPVQTAHDLVTLPEDLGLMASFAGVRGITARSASDLTTAIAGLLVSYAPVAAYYTSRFPELGARPFPPTRALALALTDTFGRVAIETFAELADRLDAYVVAGVAMAQDWQIVCASKAAMPDLPGGATCDVEDPARVLALRAPEEVARTYAYEATSPSPSTMALVFDPDGKLISRQVKTYLTPVELPGQLDLVPGTVSGGLSALRTPVGVLGFVTSKDAWMPDVTQKLDQYGVEVLVQPEFFVNDTVRPEGQWAPDTLKSSGYSDLLRHPSIEALVLPELTGNLYDFSADAQQHIALKPRSRQAPVGGLVGQPPSPGFASVAPWVVPDPVRADEPPAERRKRLGEAGLALLPSGPECEDPTVPGPCRGGQVEGVLFADVQVDAPRRYRRTRRARRGTARFTRNAPLSPTGRPQRNASLSARGRSVWAAFEERGDGASWEVWLSRSRTDGARWARPVRVSERGAEAWWPSVAAGPGGDVWVTWQQRVGERWRALLARSTDGGRTFGDPAPVDRGAPDGAHQWRPQVVAVGRSRAALVWIDERDPFAGAPGLPQAALWGATVTGGVPGGAQRLDATRDVAPLAATLDHAWAPSLSARGEKVLLAWTDFRTYDWDVWSRTSSDGGRTWSGERAVNDTPAADEALDDRPQTALLRDGTPAIAWTDWRKDADTARTPMRLYDTVVRVGTGKELQADGDGAAHRSTFSPALTVVPGGVVVAWQAHGRGPGDIFAAAVLRGRVGPARRVDDTGTSGANQWRPALAATSRRVVAVWEDERDGPPQLYVARATASRLP